MALKLLRKPRRKTSRPMLRKKLGIRRRYGLKKRISTSTPNYAVITEGAEDQLTLNNQGNFSYNFTTSLSEFERAQEVAHSYKYYRCKKIELTFVPYANISSVNGPVNARLPQLYFQIDRVANQWMVPTEAEMIERGVKPRLFKKKMVYSWKPSLLQSVQLECNQPTDGLGTPLGIDVINAVNSIPVYNKWLPTQQSFGYTPTPGGTAQVNQTIVQPSSNPYALRYYGCVFVINQEDGTEATAIGDLITRVTWEFKGPRALSTAHPGPQTTVSQATSMMTPGVVANTQPTTYP